MPTTTISGGGHGKRVGGSVMKYAFSISAALLLLGFGQLAPA
jgi:hypothetical protein